MQIMKKIVKKILLIVFLVYVVGILWFVFLIIMDDKFKTKGNTFQENIRKGTHETHTKLIPQQRKQQIIPWQRKRQIKSITIWGKAAIADYFWKHIFEGELLERTGFMLEEGHITLNNLKINYLTGPYLNPDTADKTIESLVIILNGREDKKEAVSRSWLDALLLKHSTFPHLRNLGVILLGNELCKNDWLWHYMRQFPTIVKFTFVVYDVKEMDEARGIYQWPLGVATYRKFPLISKSSVDVFTERKYKCNFLGTVYDNSSRFLLNTILEKNKEKFKCFVKVRYSWMPQETKMTMTQYHQTLKDSDLTLCPVGINSESYRIYEAMSYGSVPILEDIMTPGKCGSKVSYTNENPPYIAPFRLLKKHKAPVIYIKDWNDLPGLLQQEMLLTHRQIIDRRKEILKWYEQFRYKIREEFLDVVALKFS